jgi:alkylated DNA nucleotide flippase Atl1
MTGKKATYGHVPKIKGLNRMTGKKATAMFQVKRTQALPVPNW